MPWGVAVAAVGAYSSYQGSKKAADATEKGINVSSDLAKQARQDAIRLFETAGADGRKGITGAFDFYRQNVAKRYEPFIQANTAAQGIIGQGAQQANNAILGLPMDMSFTQPQSVTPDTSFIQNAQLPMIGAQQVQGPMQSPSEQAASNQIPVGGPRGGLDPYGRPMR